MESKPLGLNDYQERAKKTAIYPVGREALPYVVLGLNGEAGEVADKLKKAMRDNGGVISDDCRNGMIKEIGDVLWYVAMCAKELGVTLDTVASINLDKLETRQVGGNLSGSGDDR